MISRGLLWFDDDTHTPLPQKIAEAATRYQEREGYAPTVCEVNPQQQAALVLAAEAAAHAPKRKRSPKTESVAEAKGKGARRGIGSSVAAGRGHFVVDTSKLRITPNPSLRPNYILVGVEAGEEPPRTPDFGYTEEGEATQASATSVAPAKPKKATQKPRAPRIPHRATA